MKKVLYSTLILGLLISGCELFRVKSAINVEAQTRQTVLTLVADIEAKVGDVKTYVGNDETELKADLAAIESDVVKAKQAVAANASASAVVEKFFDEYKDAWFGPKAGIFARLLLVIALLLGVASLVVRFGKYIPGPVGAVFTVIETFGSAAWGELTKLVGTLGLAHIGQWVESWFTKSGKTTTVVNTAVGTVQTTTTNLSTSGVK